MNLSTFNFRNVPIAALSAIACCLIIAIPLIIGKPSVLRAIYIAAIIDKDENFHRLQSPKITFVGGSNLAFGLDSQAVESQMAKPVVNLGLNSSLGLSFMLEQARSNIRAGDLIVLSPEVEILTNDVDGAGGSAELAAVFFVYPKSLKYVTSLRQLEPIFNSFRWLLAENLKILFSPKDYLERKKTVYLRSGFNEHGDMTLHLNSICSYRCDADAEQTAGLTSGLERSTLLLRKFNREVSLRGAKAIMLPPPYPACSFSIEMKMKKLYEEVSKSTGLIMLGSSDGYLFPESYFFDTKYHLNKQGREIRTHKVVVDLENLISKAPALLTK